MNQLFDFTNRKVLITGAGSETGIGFATAQLLAQVGAEVVLTGLSNRVLDRAAQLRDAGFIATGYSCDLTNWNDINKLIANLDAKLDVLINNAGMAVLDQVDLVEQATAAELSEAGWAAALQRNLTTAFLMTKAALPLLRNSTAGRIIFVSSVTGAQMAMQHDAGYAAAKAGLIGLMRSVALDEAKFGITANAVAPGWIATGSQLSHEVAEGQVTPLGRSGSAAEVAAVIGFLASTASSYLTGQCLIVDGGNSIAEERKV